MGFINSNNEFGIWYDRDDVKHYGLLGLYDSDTDLCEFIMLPERKRMVISIDSIEIVKDIQEKRSIKLLYGVK
jgi:hypothetical protein